MDWSHLSFQTTPPLDDAFQVVSPPSPQRGLSATADESHIQMIFQENVLLKKRLENAHRELKEREEQLSDLQKRIEELTGVPINEEPTCPAPIYGRRDVPLVTETGLYDGRSNADMAFDQKCQLLEEFRREFGHLNVRLSDHERYVPLVSFIVKQRKYYRAFQTGELVSAVNKERIRKLEELGFEWSRRPDYEGEFCKMFEQLVAFKHKYGHCCVNAIPDADPDLVRFVSRQRKFIRNTKELERHHKQAENADEGEARPSGADSDSSGDEADPSTDPIELVDDVEDAAKAPTKQKKILVPKHFTKSMQTRLESLDDLFLTLDPNEIAPIADKVAQHCRTARFLKKTRTYQPNSIGWYQRFEEFRAFHTSHGHGLVPLNLVESGTLKTFVRLERALYQAIQQGVIESHPVFVKNIQFLKNQGFEYDEVVIYNEEQRLHALEVKKRRDELYHATPRGQLELMEKDAEEVKLQLQAARNVKKAAEEALSEVNKNYLKLKKKIREAEEKASNDPVGSIVHVRDRGQGKPGGKAKVTRYFVTKVLNEVLKFYDVVYVDDQREDHCIEGRFIDDAKTVSALLALGQTEEDAPQKGVVTRNKRKSIKNKPTPAQSGDGPIGTKKLKMDSPVEQPPHIRIIDNMREQRNAAAKPSSLPHEPASSQNKKRLPYEEHSAVALYQKLSTKPNEPVQPFQMMHASASSLRAGPGEQNCLGPIAGAQPSTLKAAPPQLRNIYHGNKTQPASNKTHGQHAPKEAPKPKLIPTAKPKSEEAPVKPKYPVGSIVLVRWRGEQKPGGVGKVTGFFTTKVLSEILPFYEVEYAKDMTRDACIEGRFIEEYNNLEFRTGDTNGATEANREKAQITNIWDMEQAADI